MISQSCAARAAGGGAESILAVSIAAYERFRLTYTPLVFPKRAATPRTCVAQNSSGSRVFEAGLAWYFVAVWGSGFFAAKIGLQHAAPAAFAFRDSSYAEDRHAMTAARTSGPLCKRTDSS